jgi:pimeloyl-ACP methyl ester carboxylesterase
VGSGRPVVFLHGGWGYGVYPIDRQIAAFGERVRLVAPDRSGYGGSVSVAGEMPADFHRRAAEETIAALDALKIEKPVLWGHSDGAVIAAMIGLMAPERCERLILEAFHYYRVKPRSRGFFERFHARPEDLGGETQRLLAADHGEERWQQVVSRNTGAWLRIADESVRPDEDLYGGRLGELRVPTVFLHGESDPRTEPDEMERVKRAAPQVEVRFIKGGQHSPHSEDVAGEEFNRAMVELI